MSRGEPRRGARFTIRARLTLTYAALGAGIGAVLIAVVWIFMRFVPDYAITAAVKDVDTSGMTSSPVYTAVPASPAPDYTGIVIGRAETFVVTSAGDFLQLLLGISLVALVVLSLLSALVGWVVAGRVLKPLTAINEAATIAATGSLDHRVALAGPRDEIRDLSDTFDGMLDALGRSFEAHRRFAANASHELRTPLATTQTMIDVTLADPDADAETLRALARRIHAVNRSNMQTVESLLDLADIGQRRLPHDPVDLRAVVAEAVDAVRPLAREREVTVVVHPGAATVAGDPVLLRQCVGNLVQNAVRHNHPGGTVDVRFVRNAGVAGLRLANTGDELTDELVKTLREPFVRGAGRTSGGNGGGHGLGLAIAASVAEAHDGTLRLAANPGGGLVAELLLPSAPPE